MVGVLLATAGIGIVAVPAEAAVGDSYKYYGSADAGSSIRITGSASNWSTRLYSLTGTGGATSTSGWSVDFSGSSPSSNHDYRQASWTADASPFTVGTALSATAKANRGAVEWIYKNSLPTVTLVQLRAAIKASTGVDPGNLQDSTPASNVRAATQAAIWHFTDGIDLDLTNSNPNTALTKTVYTYLVGAAAGATASTTAAPTVALASDTGRSTFSIEAGSAFGPFTLTSSTTATLSASGPATLVDATGAAITGAQSSGTQFWVKPTASPAAPGAVTVTATTSNVTTTVINAAFGRTNTTPYAPRETLGVLSTSTQSSTTTIAADWVIDQSNPGVFDATGSASQRTFVYNRPGSTSATLETIAFTDGTSTTTDIIGLAGVGTASIDAYSADWASTAVGAIQGPVVADQTRFTEKDWNQAAVLADNTGQEEVASILQRAYPTVTLSALTAALKADGRLASGAGNVKSWEAYAGAQAAIWHYTDDKELDTTRYADPVGAVASSTAAGSDVGAVLDGDTASGWRAGAAGAAVIDFTFPAAFEPRSYSVTSLAGGAAANTPTGWVLQRSVDGGTTFTTVSTSSVSATFTGGAAETKASGAIPPGASAGAWTTTLRLVFAGATDPTQPVEISGVRFEGFGVFGSQPSETYREYANPTVVVKLYEYLLARAEDDPVANPEPAVEVTASQTEFVRERTDGLIGPFELSAILAPDAAISARVTVSGDPGAGLIADPVVPTDTPQSSLDLADGDTFWIQPGDASSGSVTITAQSTAQNWVTARALDGLKSGVQGPVLTQLGVQSLSATDTLVVSFDLLPDATLSVDPTEVERGAAITITGDRFRVGETVTFTALTSADPIVLATTPGIVDADGGVEVSVVLSTELAIGTHTIVATGAQSGRAASADLAVIPTPSLTPILTDVYRGESFVVTGVGFRPNVAVDVALGDGATPVTVTSSLAGSILLTLTADAALPDGAAAIVVTERPSGRTVEAEVTVRPAPTITLDATTGYDGQNVVATVTGLRPGDVVDFELHSTPVALGSATAGLSGTLRFTAPIPAGTAVGEHHVVALFGGVELARTAVRITAAPVSTASDALTGTGRELDPLPLALALLLLGAGAIVVVTRRAARAGSSTAG